MRLAEKNISHVTELQYKGVTYNYHVSMKSGMVSDSRKFCNYDEKGRTTTEEYKKEWLPKSVQKFIDNHSPILMRAEYEDFTEYRYK